VEQEREFLFAFVAFETLWQEAGFIPYFQYVSSTKKPRLAVWRSSLHRGYAAPPWPTYSDFPRPCRHRPPHGGGVLVFKEPEYRRHGI